MYGRVNNKVLILFKVFLSFSYFLAQIPRFVKFNKLSLSHSLFLNKLNSFFFLLYFCISRQELSLALSGTRLNLSLKKKEKGIYQKSDDYEGDVVNPHSVFDPYSELRKGSPVSNLNNISKVQITIAAANRWLIRSCRWLIDYSSSILNS